MVSQTYKVKLVGTTPLLMHFDNLQWSEMIKRWTDDPQNKKNSTPGDDRTPAWRWIGNLYTDQGLVAMPSDNLMTMLREGGAKVPTGKTKGDQSFKRQTQSGLLVDQASWPILGANGHIEIAEIESLIENNDFSHHEETAKSLGFSLFAKRAKIGAAKHVRVRPRFDVWACEGTITVLEPTITKSILQSILNMAGTYCGICDWRPSSPKSPGSFGKFLATVE